jgi:hypothetical protein
VARFLVERYVPGDARQAAAEVEVRARQAAEAITAEGVAVAYLGSTVLPEDATCFCLFEAGSALDVQQANDRAGLAYLRISEALDHRHTATGQSTTLPNTIAAEVERRRT